MDVTPCHVGCRHSAAEKPPTTGETLLRLLGKHSEVERRGAYGVSRWVRILELELCLLMDNSGDDGLIGEAKPSLLSTHQLP